ncbi:MAG: hypothetical protein OK455_11070 [Thaumarchaeota archaeon]|nr:hypothetical protein [Nitrososphaerota archaeon]
MAQLVDLMKALGDKNTLTIFKAAGEGLKGTYKANEELGLSRKQYYSRIENLVDLGLVRKESGSYRQTYLGTTLGKQLQLIGGSLKRPEYLQAIGIVQDSTSFSQAEKNSLIHTLSSEVGTSQESSSQLYNSFEKLVDGLKFWIQRAEKEIILATRYYDPGIAPLIFGAFSRGVKINFIDGNPEATSFRNRLAAVMRTPPNTETLLQVKKFTTSPNVKLTMMSLAYSFFVVDGIHCGVEIPNPLNPEEFNMAISFSDAVAADKLVRYSENLRSEALRVTQKATASAIELQPLIMSRR